MKSLDHTKIIKELSLADGTMIILLDMLAAPTSVTDREVECNVYKLSQMGTILWQIDAGSGVYTRTPFTGIYIEDNGQLMGYRWDGTEYVIDVATGKAIPRALIK